LFGLAFFIQHKWIFNVARLLIAFKGFQLRTAIVGEALTLETKAKFFPPTVNALFIPPFRISIIILLPFPRCFSLAVYRH